jgi:pyruvate/2-oxoglutarate/acetoin dehydrogenase E1 component/TPP-dependent pyruvate/acetoin dehydrogenase alpha subunit
VDCGPIPVFQPNFPYLCLGQINYPFVLRCHLYAAKGTHSEQEPISVTIQKTATSSSVKKLKRNSILHDYYLCCLSREISVLIRKEVLTGRAKFGVSDDGKELFQIALAKTYRPGDWRSDYYRGHTLLLALGLCKPEDIFAQLYADVAHDPFSGGRQMNGHHATPTIDAQGQWLPQTDRINLSSDISTTGGQMARGLGLAFASKVYRAVDHFDASDFSSAGQEVCFCQIGDASTSEGAFWEAMNAAAVVQCPLAMTVVDDGYGISVPKEYQTVKSSISKALAGFETETEADNGIDIYHLKGWDYATLVDTYAQGIKRMRDTHRPALFHVDELTQPQGHSTSGSHERYKSKERLAWEKEYDCNRQFRLWLLATDRAEAPELRELEAAAKQAATEARDQAWQAFIEPLKAAKQRVLTLLGPFTAAHAQVAQYHKEVSQLRYPTQSELLAVVRRAAFALRGQDTTLLDQYIDTELPRLRQAYGRHLTSETAQSALRVQPVAAEYGEQQPTLNGYELINRFFDQALARYPRLYAFGEDVGQIGDVNQGFSGLQEKYGEHRVFDTGIREWTIVGQAIGMAMRGLRPIAEIQYLDYLLYAFSPLSDDLATVRWRSNGLQAAPVIIRTRGHRLEGIWHSGSPMSVLLGGLRGMHICVPRNMTQAAGMYNTLLQSDDPALVIEVLNGYRRKEQLPSNLDTFSVPLGVPELLREGTDITVVSYGACLRLADEACELLATMGISVELLDVQTLLPFDLEHRIGHSLRKTNRLLVVDEDVPGGAAAYIMQHVLQDQAGYFQLDAPPTTLTATAHRPAYGDDGNYVSKPSVEDIVEKVLEVVEA